MPERRKGFRDTQGKRKVIYKGKVLSGESNVSQQNTEEWRKVRLRAKLLEQVPKGPAYVPYCGTFEIGEACYMDRDVFAADINPQFVFDTQRKLATRPQDDGLIGEAIPSNVEEAFPAFEFLDGQSIVVADFDAYSYPWDAFRAFWDTAPKADRMAMFFTDGQRQIISRFHDKRWHHPNGERIKCANIAETRKTYNFYWPRIVKPFLEEYVKPYRLVDSKFYLRWVTMLYCGVVIERG